MRNQQQGVRSTKAKYPHPGTESPTAEKKHDFFIHLYEPKGAMYIDQTRNFPHGSSWGNRNQMIRNEIDGNYTWIEPMKKDRGGDDFGPAMRLRMDESERHSTY